MKNIGNMIKRRRKELNMTQIELAERLGVSNSFISQMENGYSNVSIKKLEEAGSILGINIYEYGSIENELLNKWKEIINTFEDRHITPKQVTDLIHFITLLKTG
jgi:transcriptional regulator with XRE-family HTH domain